MRTVLGIDAAWTLTNPSGVALVEETPVGWRLRAVESSYDGFHALAGGAPPDASRPTGSRPDAGRLLATCRNLTGRFPDLVAVDMPLSRLPIVGRRLCDRLVSSAWGARKCATHSPSAVRPGRISDELRGEFEAAGYVLWTRESAAKAGPGLIEVYPHPALVELTGAASRLPYKAGKTKGYWPDLDPRGRRERLFAQWLAIVEALDAEIAGVQSAFPEIAEGASGFALKAHEDKLDAVVCAWVGARVLRGRANAFGDADAAIWIPSPSTRSGASSRDARKRDFARQGKTG
jgi:predicted RNase H-like nuclease